MFQNGYKIHQAYGVPAAYVVDGIAYLILIRFRSVVEYFQNAVYDIVYVREIAAKISVVEYFDGLFAKDSPGKSMGAMSGLPHGPYTVKKRNPVVGISYSLL